MGDEDRRSRSAGTGTVLAPPTAAGSANGALPFARRPGTTGTLAVQPDLVARGPTLPFAGSAEAAAPAPAHAAPGAPWNAASATPVSAPATGQETVPAAEHQSLVPTIQPEELALVAFPWWLAGTWVLVVVAKATADLRAGAQAAVRPRAEPLSPDRGHAEGSSSLRYPSDYAVLKERVDVMAVGNAHPAGGVAPAALVRFGFGEPGRGFERRVAVFGDRRWERSLLGVVPSAPTPFRAMPLVYERAFGGPGHATNPLGRGHGNAAGALPNLEDPAQLIRRPDDAPPPVCLGPLGTPSPQPGYDFDWCGFQRAPASQQLDQVRGGEPFLCEAMNKRSLLLQGTLPAVAVQCLAQRRGSLDPVGMRIDTVLFDTDALTITLLWRGRLPIADARASDVVRLIATLDRPSR